MKWLIYGGNGWIGGLFIKVANDKASESGETIEIIKGKARCNEYNNLKNEIEEVCPDRIASFIGRTSAPIKTLEEVKNTDISTIDFLEKPGNLRYNLSDNLIGALNIERICFEKNIHFTYFGTGCIYTYADEPLTFGEEDSPTFFGSSYSTVKGFTDQWMHHSPNVANIRIRMPIVYDNIPKNFLTKIIQYPNIQSCVNSMTVLDDLLPVLYDIVYKGKVGTFHLVNPGPMDHDSILKLYRDICDPSKTWNLIDEKQLGTILKSARSRCILSTDNILKDYDIPCLRDSLIKIFTSWKN